MKKNILRVLIIVTILVLSFGLVGCSGKSFDTKSSEKQNFGDEALDFMTTLSVSYPDRTANTNGDLSACKYIAGLMTSYGYVPTAKGNVEGTAGVVNFVYNFVNEKNENESKKSYNVIFGNQPKENSKGKIILTAQYDNAYNVANGNAVIGGDGSYESGASIATMLTIAHNLSKAPLEYDIVFAFLGAGTFSYGGALDFYNSMNAEELQSISLMINYSNLVGGDFTYAYAQDKATDYGNFFDSVASANKLEITKAPLDKRVARGILLDDSIVKYFHEGMIGNHLYFANGGVPTLNFFSANWSDHSLPGLVEMKGKPNILQTGDDTLAQMSARCGGEEVIKNRLSAVIEDTVYAISGQNQEMLFASLSTARSQMPNKIAQGDTLKYTLQYGLKILVVAGIVGVFFMFRKKISENKEKYLVYLNKATGGSAAPQPEKPIDVFGFGTSEGDKSNDKPNDKPSDSGKSGGDDVFEGF